MVKVSSHASVETDEAKGINLVDHITDHVTSVAMHFTFKPKCKSPALLLSNVWRKTRISNN